MEGTGDGHDLPVTVIRDLLVGTLRWIHILRAATTEHANGKTDTRGESQGMKERGIEETGETEGCSDVMLGAMTMIDELQETEICSRGGMREEEAEAEVVEVAEAIAMNSHCSKVLERRA